MGDFPLTVSELGSVDALVDARASFSAALGSLLSLSFITFS